MSGGSSSASISASSPSPVRRDGIFLALEMPDQQIGDGAVVFDQ